MDDAELQQAAREAIEGHTQADVADALELNQSTISLALNHRTPSRYAKTLKKMIEHFGGYRIETTTTTVHRVAGEA